MRRHARKSSVVAVAVVALVAAAGAAAWLVLRGSGTSSTAPPTTTAPVSRLPAPAAVSNPKGFGNSRLQPVGVSSDGWVGQDAQLSLAGGSGLGVLAIRGNVPAADGQQLTVLVDSRTLSSQPLGPGRLDLRLLVPPRSGNHRVELRFAKTVKLRPPDTRTVAARLTGIGIEPLTKAPRAIPIPTGLLRPSVLTTGIESDGWMGTNGSVALTGGDAAALELRGQLPQLPNGAQQHVHVLVNGDVVIDETVAPGNFDLRAPVAASSGVRDVEIGWSGAAPLSKQDSRRLAARLTSVSLEPLRGVSSLRLPSGLLNPRIAYSGIYADGWAQKDVRVVLAGGPTAKLAVETMSELRRQQVQVLVDGRTVVGTEIAGGPDTVEVPLVASRSPRILELRFARVAPISTQDPRRAAALLRRITVHPLAGGAPVSVRFPADIRRSGVVYSGVYRDGWAEGDVRLVVARGRATQLTVKALTTTPHQRMTVLVNGRRLGAAAMPRGRDVVRVRLRASAKPRLLELKFAREARISPKDPRQAATLLKSVALAAGSSAARATTPGLHANLTMSDEVPPLTGTAGGTFTGTIAGSTLRWQFVTHGLSGPIIAAVIHAGTAGQVGPSLADLCRPCTSSASGTLDLSSSTLQAIRSGGAYVNVGTPTNAYGEIRGPIAGG